MQEWPTLWATSWPSKPCFSRRTGRVCFSQKLRIEAANLTSPISPHSRAPLVISASVSTLGGLLFGYDNIVISGAIGYLSQLFHLDAVGIGWAAGCALIGCIVGCAVAGTLADHLGKKKGLAFCATCFALSSAGIFFAPNLHQFVVWESVRLRSFVPTTLQRLLPLEFAGAVSLYISWGSWWEFLRRCS